MSAVAVKQGSSLLSDFLDGNVLAKTKRLRRNFKNYGALSSAECARVVNWATQMLDQAPPRRIVLTGLEPNTHAEMLRLVNANFRLRVIGVDGPAIIIDGLFNDAYVNEYGDVAAITVGRRRKQMKTVIERDGSCCVWCSRELSYLHPLATLDHVIPAYYGGDMSLRNALLACRRCNGSRHHLSAFTWLAICRARGQKVQTNAIFERLADLYLGADREIVSQPSAS